VSNLQQFAANMEKFANDLQRNTPHNIVSNTAKAYTTSIRNSIDAVTSGGKLSGVGSKARRAGGGTRVGVKYDVRDAPTSSTAIVQATGPLQLIERDTSQHSIPRTVSSRRLRTAAGRLSHKRETTGRNLSSSAGGKFLGNPAKHFAAMGPVSHPGTKGKHPFERGALAAERAQQNEAIQQVAATMAKFFKAA
jgi:hypothetical protein